MDVIPGNWNERLNYNASSIKLPTTVASNVRSTVLEIEKRSRGWPIPGCYLPCLASGVDVRQSTQYDVTTLPASRAARRHSLIDTRRSFSACHWLTSAAMATDMTPHAYHAWTSHQHTLTYKPVGLSNENYRFKRVEYSLFSTKSKLQISS